jgi:hypothetical protein
MIIGPSDLNRSEVNIFKKYLLIDSSPYFGDNFFIGHAGTCIDGDESKVVSIDEKAQYIGGSLDGTGFDYISTAYGVSDSIATAFRYYGGRGYICTVSPSYEISMFRTDNAYLNTVDGPYRGAIDYGTKYVAWNFDGSKLYYVKEIYGPGSRPTKTYQINYWNYDTDAHGTLGIYIGHEITGFDCHGEDNKDILVFSGDIAPVYTYSTSIEYNPTISKIERQGIYTYIVDNNLNVSGPFYVDIIDNAGINHYRKEAKLNKIRFDFPYEEYRYCISCIASESETNSDGTNSTFSSAAYYLSADGQYWSQMKLIDKPVTDFPTGFRIFYQDGKLLLYGFSNACWSEQCFDFGRLSLVGAAYWDLSTYIESHESNHSESRQSHYAFKNPENILQSLGFMSTPLHLYMIVQLSLDEIDWTTYSIEEIENISSDYSQDMPVIMMEGRDKVGNLKDKNTAINSIQFDNTLTSRDNFIPLTNVNTNSGLAHSVVVLGSAKTENYTLVPIPTDTEYETIVFSSFKSNIDDGEVAAIFQPPPGDMIWPAYAGVNTGVIFRAQDKKNFYRFRFAHLPVPGYPAVSMHLEYNNNGNYGIIYSNVDLPSEIQTKFENKIPMGLKVEFKGRSVKCYYCFVSGTLPTNGSRYNTAWKFLFEIILDGDGATPTSPFTDPVFHSGYVGIYMRSYTTTNGSTDTVETPYSRVYDFNESSGGWQSNGTGPNHGYLLEDGVFKPGKSGTRGGIYYSVRPSGYFNWVMLQVQTENPNTLYRFGYGSYASNWMLTDLFGKGILYNPAPHTANPFPNYVLVDLFPNTQDTFWIEFDTSSDIIINGVIITTLGLTPFDKAWRHTIDLTLSDGGFSALDDSEWVEGVGWQSTNPSNPQTINIRLTMPHVGYVSHVFSELNNAPYEHYIKNRTDRTNISGNLIHYNADTTKYRATYFDSNVAPYLDYHVTGYFGQLTLSKVIIDGFGANPFIGGEWIGRQLVQVPLNNTETHFDNISIDSNKPFIKHYTDRFNSNYSSLYGHWIDALYDGTTYLNYNQMDYGVVPYTFKQNQYGYYGTTTAANIPPSKMNYPLYASQSLWVEGCTVEAWQPVPTNKKFGCVQFETSDLKPPLTIENLYRFYAAFGGIYKCEFKSSASNFSDFILEDTPVYVNNVNSLDLSAPNTGYDSLYATYNQAVPSNFWLEFYSHIDYPRIKFYANGINGDADEYFVVGIGNGYVYLDNYIDSDDSVQMVYAAPMPIPNQHGKIQLFVRNVLTDSVLNSRAVVITLYLNGVRLFSVNVDSLDLIGRRIILEGYTETIGPVYSDFRIPNMTDILEWSSLDPGETPMTSIARAIEDRYIKQYLDNTDTLKVFKPYPETPVAQIKDYIERIEYNIDTRQLITDLRLRGPFHWVRVVDEELLKRFNDRFYQLDNTSQFSAEDCRREAELFLRRQRENLNQYHYELNGYVLLQPEDTIQAIDPYYHTFFDLIINDISIQSTPNNFLANINMRKKVS